MRSQSQQSSQAPRNAAQWRIAKGSAMTFRPRQPGVLQVAEGRAWATLSGSGDLFLVPGCKLPLGPRQSVVLESWSNAVDGSVSLVWSPEAGTAAH